ncbi:uncharacterized protein PHACADRAFT_197627 [Phanerochaete carnosa HHB-10118-sp]|uniref:Uncharacterized protein n=1 Tax=Phanerochaete carnosa (strain HHB-10118-sp) TaxID=650164 RepID=K5UTC7_PHACS|nr:uncharacterized protein PHACADRAFT_197627 [Phanerochaete carnosa HHB-10118-sp]EKM53206.1 hypothetical protein PHACADRAFT_197627 [Phanerochaete carnosa HHB-10118-sp]
MSAGAINTSNELNAHEVRITSHGKMNVWVDFALKFFEENPDKPLTLHTLPVPSQSAARERDAVSCSPASASTPAAAENKLEKMHPSMALIPRLISVVEVIKREYVKLLDPVLAEKDQLSGLYQYNELGELDLSHGKEVDPEESRRKELVTMLQGKNHLKIKKVAYMKVTLSRKELSHALRRPHTYQKPVIRKLSKSTRSRAKRRMAKEADAPSKS